MKRLFTVSCTTPGCRDRAFIRGVQNPRRAHCPRCLASRAVFFSGRRDPFYFDRRAGLTVDEALAAWLASPEPEVSDRTRRAMGVRAQTPSLWQRIIAWARREP